MLIFCFLLHTVPPKQMKITNEKGVEVDDVIGPFDEDSTLILVCVVVGGKGLCVPITLILKFRIYKEKEGA